MSNPAIAAPVGAPAAPRIVPSNFVDSLKKVSETAVMAMPIVVSFSLMMNSFISGDSKALFFIFGSLLLYGINLLFVDNFIGKRFVESLDVDNTLVNFLQRIFKFKMGGEFRKTPGFTVPFMSFALMYLCLPLRNMPKDADFPLLMVFVLVLLTLSSIITSVKLIGSPGIHLLSVILGMLWGAAWYAIVKGKKDHPSGDTYFSANSSNTAKCSRPSTQAFKCTVYKNGKPVGDINT